jgi:hypothetical protein
LFCAKQSKKMFKSKCDEAREEEQKQEGIRSKTDPK